MFPKTKKSKVAPSQSFTLKPIVCRTLSITAIYNGLKHRSYLPKVREINKILFDLR